MRRRLALALTLWAALAMVPMAAAFCQPAEPAKGEGAAEPGGTGVSPDERQAFVDSVKEQLLTGGAAERVAAPWYWQALERTAWGLGLMLLGWVVFRLVSMALKRAEARMARQTASMSATEARRRQHVSTVIDLIRNAARYVIVFAVATLVLDRSIGVNIWPILTGAGILGIAVAFGSQALVRDVVTGVFQLLEGQYAVGDYVQIGAAFGRVEDVGLRVTRLRDLQGKVYFVPNGTISLVTTYDSPSVDYVLQAPLAEPEQAESALAAIQALAKDLHAEYPELLAHVEEPAVTSSPSGMTAVRMPLGIVPTQEWLVTTEIPARVKQLFAEREIAVPEGRLATCYLDISPRARMPKEAKT